MSMPPPPPLFSMPPPPPRPPAARPAPPDAATPAAGPETTAAALQPEQAAPPSAPGEPPVYDPPEWSGAPGLAYELECVKNGVTVGRTSLASQAVWRLGRHAASDLVLDHPSASRLHAVLQFRGPDAFAWDAGSTHGTFLNKRRLAPRVFAPLRVGDQLRFGASQRYYIFNGPAELLPEEGLSRDERAQLRQLEAVAAAADEAALRAMALVKARFGAEGGGGGATWGQTTAEAGDLEGEAPAGGDLDWRTYKGKLSERQERSMEKLRKKEATLSNLRAEVERIQAKEGQEGGLTAGQAAQVARNETRIAQLSEELAAAEEVFNETLAESAAARARAAGEAAADAQGPPGAAAAARKRRAALAAEEAAAAAAGSDSDEFYDRTRGDGVAKKARLALPQGGAAGAETAGSLWAKREAVRLAVAALEAKASAPVAAAAEEEDEVGAFLAQQAAREAAAAGVAARSRLTELAAEEARLTRLLRLADPLSSYTGPRAPLPPPARPAQPPPAARAAAAAAAAAVFGQAQEEVTDGTADEDGFLAPAALKAQFGQKGALAAMEAALGGSAGTEQGGLVAVRRARAPSRGAPLSDDALQAAAAASAAADVARLLAGGQGVAEEEAEAGAGWVPRGTAQSL